MGAHMRIALLALPSALLALAGCVAQPPAEQIAPQQETVRLCQEGYSCSEQPRNVQTFQGTPTDPQAERRLQALTDLAERNPKAAYDLGLRYLRGDGVDQNGYQAIQWMRKAGEAGLMDAQLALGRLYLAGYEEMGSDPAQAEAWLMRAGGQGSKEAKRLLPEAQAAKKDEQEAYRVREHYRRNSGRWYYSVPYYWVWAPSGWYLR